MQRLTYLINPQDWRRENREFGANYTDAYIHELCSHLGVTAHALTPAQLLEPAELALVRTLIIGQRSGRTLEPALRQTLAEWVEAGGTLIGLAVRGLDELFGVQRVGRSAQWPDDYTTTAYWHPVNHPLTLQVLPLHYQHQRQPILSDVELVGLAGAAEVARLFDSNQRDLEAPAMTWRRVGRGAAGYFTFDVAKTVWMLHQGRPLGTHLQTSARMSLLGHNLPQVPYADVVTQVLGHMLAHAGHAQIHPVPPQDQRMAQAAFYWGGDEYLGPSALSLRASDFMREQGLPYHINIRIQDHPLTADELAHIHRNGHEVSLYLNTIDGQPRRFDLAYFQQQVAHLRERFNLEPGAVLMMNLQWQGWTELPRAMAQAGIPADNTLRSYDARPQAPLHNGPAWGFAFGTAFPFFFYDDAAHDNQRIDVVEQPVAWYELGHRGTIPPYDDCTTRVLDDVQVPIDTAVKYHWVLNTFYHPASIVNRPACRDAIKYILQYIQERGYRVVHLSNNQAAAWWRHRAGSSVQLKQLDAQRGCYTADCAHPQGMTLRIPLHDRQPTQALLDGRPTEHELRTEFGVTWAYVFVPAGVHEVELTLTAAARESIPAAIALNGWTGARPAGR